MHITETTPTAVRVLDASLPLVLLVDDDPLHARVLCEALRDRQVHVRMMTEVPGALEACLVLAIRRGTGPDELERQQQREAEEEEPEHGARLWQGVKTIGPSPQKQAAPRHRCFGAER